MHLSEEIAFQKGLFEQYSHCVLQTIEMNESNINSPSRSRFGTLDMYNIIQMVNNKTGQRQFFDNNYLTNLNSQKVSQEQIYGSIKEQKNDFTYIRGNQSHLIRRKLILQKYPQIAQLLIPNKHYTIIIALSIICLALANCYWAKDQNIWVWLIDAYLIGGLLNHTLHICVHDFTHFGGHRDMSVNKIMAALCNIPMALPSAMSFGRYHSEHHNFFSEENEDPDLPLAWQAKLSYNTKWYKYIFYLLIQCFYALRPLLIKNSKLTKDQIYNYAFIIMTNCLICHYWGSSALYFCLIASASSIGPHPAAIHIIAEHYQFVKGQQTYDYIGIWNFFNLDVGYHTQHHDFPNAPWYNLRKIRRIAPQFYQYLPTHTSYWKVITKFLSDPNFNLFHRIIRVPAKSE